MQQDDSNLLVFYALIFVGAIFLVLIGTLREKIFPHLKGNRLLHERNEANTRREHRWAEEFAAKAEKELKEQKKKAKEQAKYAAKIEARAKRLAAKKIEDAIVEQRSQEILRDTFGPGEEDEKS